MQSSHSFQTAPAIIEFNHMAKGYQKNGQTNYVHQHFNLTINRGEFVALMGPSGLGKSTLLHLMGGLDQPSSGEIMVAGAKLHQMSEQALADWRAQHIGFVFQAHHLLPVISAQANVELPLTLGSLTKKARQQQVQTALALVNMTDKASHLPKELSGGQEQRIAIARAIVTNPDILLCDEPTGNLDRTNAKAILALLQQLNQQFGKTIVMVTHDESACEYASRVIHLEQYIAQQQAQQPTTQLED